MFGVFFVTIKSLKNPITLVDGARIVHRASIHNPIVHGHRNASHLLHNGMSSLVDSKED